ncbi:hypothetical protein B3286c1_1943 [Brucella vulpis]|uniref:hypothetical protein n=1 Tax=Brucella vulpis TaxID=981386 RepID=UPI00073AE1E5|nr:hypothetical protein BF3285c1_1944 [Brucella vulpis]CUW50742.1 hypothetical protein B3286c1_1943 [Brucella vulpis]
MKNPSIFGSSQKRGVLIPICSRFESVTFRESEAILTLPEVCQQSEARSSRLRLLTTPWRWLGVCDSLGYVEETQPRTNRT